MSKFVLSCTTCATRAPGKDEVLECFKHAPAAGFKAWGIAGPVTWTPGLARWINVDLVRERAIEAGLETCTEVYAPAWPPDSTEVAQRAAADVALLFDFAERLDCPLVVMSARRRQPGGLEAVIAGLKELLPLIAGSPVRLALEPHHGAQIQFAEDYDGIFAEIDTPQVGMTMDTGHFHSGGVDWRALMQKYADRVYNIHVKDHLGTQSVALGQGEVDLRGFIEALHAIGYEGALALELEVVDPENLPRYCAEAYVLLDRLVREVTGEPPAEG